jgi:hypothetical protein
MALRRRQLGHFGYAREVAHTLGFKNLRLTQPESLEKMAELIQRGSIDPLVRTTAHQILQSAGLTAASGGARDDDAELHAIYDAVKNGDPNVPALRTGFMYVNDPRYADYFTSAPDSLRACLKGACAGDCDDHGILIGSLLASIGWRVGVRGWGPPGEAAMIHVYPVVAYPKRAQTGLNGSEGYARSVGLDSTVDEAYVGWEPPKSDQVVTVWIE